jgi:hypothetical protein
LVPTVTPKVGIELFEQITLSPVDTGALTVGQLQLGADTSNVVWQLPEDVEVKVTD